MRRASTLSTVFLLLASSAFAEDDSEDEAPAPEAPAERDRGLAIGVGTGPQPFSTLTLGLTGLGGRILVPAGPGSLLISGGHTSFRGSAFGDGAFADRDFLRAGASTLALGYRGGAPPAEPDVVFYGLAQLMGVYAATGAGNPGDVWGTGSWAVGGLGGVGVDGFVNPWVSAGVEVGGMGAMGIGGERGDHASDDKVQGVVMSTFASAQLTVWK